MSGLQKNLRIQLSCHRQVTFINEQYTPDHYKP